MPVQLTEFQLDKAALLPIRQQLFQLCQQAINEGRWPAAAKLPSVRQLAGHLQISNFTVAELYDRLQAQSLVVSRPGSGFYVARQHAIRQLSDHNSASSQLAHEVALMRQTLQREPDWLKPAAGWLSPQYLPEQQIRAALKEVAREGTALTDYGPAQGYLPLRQYLSQRLSQLSIAVSANQLLLTSSATHALDLVIRMFLRPGERVLVDDPGFYNFQAMLRLHQLELVYLPRTIEGPDLDALAQILQQSPVRAYLTNSVLSNPVGSCLSQARAFAVLTLLKQHQVLLIEDDIYADFESSPAPRYSAMAGFEHCIYIGSLSKTISADLRVGYITGSAERIAALTDLKLMTATASPATVERVVYKVLVSGGYQRHRQQLITQLEQLRSDVIRQFIARGFTPSSVPSGGFALWLRLPEVLSARLLAQAMLAQRVVLAPGSHFSQWPDADSFMRVNITNCTAAFWPLLDATLRSLLPADDKERC